jgi:hypothetical protein
MTTQDRLPITKIQQFVEKQIRERTIPEAAYAFERLCQAGYTEEEAKRRIVLTLATEQYRSIYLGLPTDKAMYEDDLRRLPILPWESAEETEITEALVVTRILENPELNLMTAEETVARYRQLRTKSTRIFNEILKQVVKDGIMDSAKTLGLVKDDDLLLGSECEMAVMMDHALFADQRKRIRNIDEYLSGIPEPDEDTFVVTEALRDTRYCLLQVEAIIPNCGAQVFDKLRGDRFRLVDISLSETAVPNLILATHVFAPDGIHITTGAVMPITDLDAAGEIDRLLKRTTRDEFDSKNTKGELTTRIVRTLLEHGAGNRIGYTTLGEAVGMPASSSHKVGPNAPCPCGSGKKYKRCCGSI